MDENKIYRNADLNNGPLDGVQLRTDCIRTKFTKKTQATGYKFKQYESKANISASVETGTFSIRDMQTDTMIAIRIEDAMAVCAAAAEASKEVDGCITKGNAEAAEAESDS